MFFATVHKD